jgi:subtilisin
MKKLLLLVVCAFAGVAVTAATASAGRAVPGRYIVVLKPTAQPGVVARGHQQVLGAEVRHIYRSALRGYAGRLTPAALRALRFDMQVAYILPDRPVHALAQTAPTGVQRIEASTDGGTQTLTNDGAGVNVAVIDTGIDLSHSDLSPVVSGKNCVRTRKPPTDDNGHGSHVAGTIAARENGSGVVGVAPAANLYAVKVLNQAGSGTWSQVICGIDWVTSTRTDSNPSNDIAIANMSLGGTGSDDGNCGNSNGDVLHQAICRSVAAGVTYVVAAGNSALNEAGQVPAAYDEVLTVSAVADFNGQPGGGAPATCRTDVDDTFADFSNFAVSASDQSHTIAAPGVCINSTWRSGGYNTISGTSMASPHVAGVAALCIASGACVGTPTQVIQKIRSDAQSHSTAFPGYGFTGSPFSGSQYFGYLSWAGGY